jgi:hypothetical protein
MKPQTIRVSAPPPPWFAVPYALDHAPANNVGGERHLGGVPVQELVLVRERHQQQVPGFDLAPLAAGGLDRAAACRDQMKDADMAQMRHRHAFVVALGRDHAERRGEAGAQEHRTGQAHRPQHVGEGIGPLRGRGPRRFGK